jgi:putative ABC transport system permease protein
MLQNVRYALRGFLRSPRFTVAAVIALALGIGVNSAMFSVIKTALFRVLPFPEAEQIGILWQDGIRSRPYAPTSSSLRQWIDHMRSIKDTTVVSLRPVELTGVPTPEELQGCGVSQNFLSLVRVQPVFGRGFQPEEYTQVDAGGVVILSDRLWRRQFQGDPAVLGKTIMLGGDARTVVGVMPAGFWFPREDVELWLPLSIGAGSGALRVANRLQVFGRLPLGTTLQQSSAEITTLLSGLAATQGEAKGVRVVRLSDALVQNIRPIFLALGAGVAFILLIAGANVGGLLLTRAIGRRREIAVRMAIGASRSAIIRQFLTESLLLGLMGGLLGLLLAHWWIRAVVLVLADSTNLPSMNTASIDSSVAVFTLLISIATALIFGLGPVIPAIREDVNSGLKEGAGDVGNVGHRQWIRATLVVAEVALSIMLLMGAGLMIRTLLQLREIDLGFRPDHLLTMTISKPLTGVFPSPPQFQMLSSLLARVERYPGVLAAGLSSVLPMEGMETQKNFAIEGAQEILREEERVAGFSYVSSGYFAAMGMRLVKGRFFTESDTQGGKVVIISESMAQRFWPEYRTGDQPLGRRIIHGFPTKQAATIVGVVKDVRLRLIEDTGRFFLYFPYEQADARMAPNFLALRASDEPSALFPLLRHELQLLNKDRVVAPVNSMEVLIARLTAEQRAVAFLLACFSGLALFLATVGLYGAISYSVSRRTREFALRIALGAQQVDVLTIVLRQGAALILLGMAIGILGAFSVKGILSSLLFGVTPMDPVTLLLVSLLVGSAALTATLPPAIRATKVDPLIALRQD